jgi:AcrR family transcriptional regulator
MTTDAGTREQILDAAIALIESEGESAVRVDRVVASAGFTKPVLYHHFTDKDDVIVNAQAERYRRSLEWANLGVAAMTDKVKSKKEFETRLAAAIATFVTAESRHHRSVRNEVLGSSVSRPELQEAVANYNRAFISWLEVEIERWRTSGWTNPQFSSRDLAQWWAVQIHGRYFVEAGRDNEEPDEWLDVLLSTVRYVLDL